jgi:hypothetical protein
MWDVPKTAAHLAQVFGCERLSRCLWRGWEDLKHVVLIMVSKWVLILLLEHVVIHEQL